MKEMGTGSYTLPP